MKNEDRKIFKKKVWRGECLVYQEIRKTQNNT